MTTDLRSKPKPIRGPESERENVMSIAVPPFATAGKPSRVRPERNRSYFLLSVLILVAAGTAGVWLLNNNQSPAATTPAPTDSLANAPVSTNPAAHEEARAMPVAHPVVTHFDDLVARLRHAVTEGTALADLKELLAQIAAQNPLLAMELIDRLGRSEAERYAAMAEVVQPWAALDPGAALDWGIRQLNRWDAMDANFSFLILRQVAQDDPQQVIALAEDALLQWTRYGATSSGDFAYLAINSLLTQGDPKYAQEAIERWIDAGLATQISYEALERAAEPLANEAPARAVAWLQSLPASPGRDEALGTLAARWAEQAPQAAALWAAALDPANGRATALRRTLATWAEQDVLGAAQWLVEREADPSIDPILADLAAHSPLTSSNPVVALKFAEAIADPARRTTSIETILIAWHEREAGAALAHIAQHAGLAPAEKQRLSQMLMTP